MYNTALYLLKSSLDFFILGFNVISPSLFQVLMTEPAHGNKSDEKGKEVKKNGIKNNREVASGEEMDSRLLSALLTVSYPTSLISWQKLWSSSWLPSIFWKFSNIYYMKL